MLRVFLDANVLFSASNAESPIAVLIQLLIEKGQAVTSDFAVEEAGRNITLKRPVWSDAFHRLIDRMEVVASIQFDLPVALPQKDQPILCTAIRSRCNYLATGDKRDFGHLYGRTVKGITVISLLQLAKLLTKN